MNTNVVALVPSFMLRPVSARSVEVRLPTSGSRSVLHRLPTLFAALLGVCACNGALAETRDSLPDTDESTRQAAQSALAQSGSDDDGSEYLVISADVLRVGHGLRAAGSDDSGICYIVRPVPVTVTDAKASLTDVPMTAIATRNGTAQSGTTRNGTAWNGTARSGKAWNVTWRNGIRPHGTTPNGTTRNEAARNSATAGEYTVVPTSTAQVMSAGVTTSVSSKAQTVKVREPMMEPFKLAVRYVDCSDVPR